MSKSKTEKENSSMDLENSSAESNKTKTKTKTIAVIGGGYYGCHTALQLAKAGHKVKIIESKPKIFAGISGKFAARIHGGSHYPQDYETRIACRLGLAEFVEVYGDLVVHLSHAHYVLGSKDADNLPPKVSVEAFKAVGEECNGYKLINPDDFGYTNTLVSMEVDEPCAYIGERLRNTFIRLLEEAGVEICYNLEVRSIRKQDEKMLINNLDQFDHVVNTTSFKAFQPNLKLPFDFSYRYQPCVVLIYEDQEITDKYFSYTIMDGRFGCLMPRADGSEKPGDKKKYYYYHAKGTIISTEDSFDKAKQSFSKVNDEFVEKNMRPEFESEMDRFFKGFSSRFKYCGWEGEILAKANTETEFRNALTFKDNQDIIQVFPGKINNIFAVGREVEALITNQNILRLDRFAYVENGALDIGIKKGLLKEANRDCSNSCSLQPYSHLLRQSKPIPIYKNLNFSCTFFDAKEEPPYDASLQSTTPSEEYLIETFDL
ncbi:MAG: FAD-binding oxidoreductase [Tatlockia sp.]|nr:FAD-binding oxidoreductase [Tatlockia sp.]